MLVVEGVTKTFPGVKALDHVDLEVRAGEVHALVGENGAGKSTLVKILGGALLPDEGKVLCGGDPLPLGNPQATRLAGVSIIYQEFNLVPELTMTENLFLGREMTRHRFLQRGDMESRTGQILDQLGCNCSPRARVAGLSVGVRQLVEIARALSADARVLVFDEPSATLTDQELERLFETIRSLRERGLGIVYISHRLEEIFELADRVTVLRDGRWIATSEVDRVDRNELIRWMVGRDLESEYPERSARIGEPILQVCDLSAPPFFERVSFEVGRGEVVGMAGLVGSGRTSVGLSLFGLRKPVGGEVRLGGEVVEIRSPREALDRGLAYLTEDRKGQGIFPELSVAENITLSNLATYTRSGFLSEDRIREAVKSSCDRFDVRAPSPKHSIATLSGGNQQKALLARLFLHPVRVAVLDEPTRGVDVGARAEVYRLIGTLAESGLGLLVISSELPELLGLCDRIYVMREGVTTGCVDADGATQETIMALATHLPDPERKA